MVIKSFIRQWIHWIAQTIEINTFVLYGIPFFNDIRFCYNGIDCRQGLCPLWYKLTLRSWLQSWSTSCTFFVLSMTGTLVFALNGRSAYACIGLLLLAFYGKNSRSRIEWRLLTCPTKCLYFKTFDIMLPTFDDTRIF